MILPWVLVAIMCAQALLALRRAPQDALGRKPLLSAHNLVVWLAVVYIIFPAVLILANGGRFTWAPAYGTQDRLTFTLFCCVIALAAFQAGDMLSRALTRTWSRRKGGRRLASRRVAPTRAVQFVPLVLLLAGVALKIFLIVSTGGWEAMLLRLSGVEYDYTGVGALEASSIALRTVSGIADVAATWFLLDALRRRRHVLIWVAVFAAVLLISYASIGKRLALLVPVLAVLVGVHFLRRAVTTRAAPLLLLGIAGFGMVTLLIRVFVPAIVAEVRIDLDQVDYASGSLIAYYFYSLEFSTVEMMTVAIQSREAVQTLFGGASSAFLQTDLLPFTYTVPRELWAEKPDQYFDLSYAINAVIAGRPVEDTTIGYVTTLVGNSWVTLGFAGVVLAFLGLGAITGQVDRLLTRRRWTPESVLAYSFLLVLVFHLFRMGSLAWAFLIGVVQQYGLLAGFVLILIARVRRRVPIPVSRPIGPRVAPANRVGSLSPARATVPGGRT